MSDKSWMTPRPVSHAEARVSCDRLINSHFGRPDGARVSVPEILDRDDLVLSTYIEQRAASEADLQAEVKALRGALERYAPGQMLIRCETPTVGGYEYVLMAGGQVFVMPFGSVAVSVIAENPSEPPAVDLAAMMLARYGV